MAAAGGGVPEGYMELEELHVALQLADEMDEGGLAMGSSGPAPKGSAVLTRAAVLAAARKATSPVSCLPWSFASGW